MTDSELRKDLEEIQSLLAPAPNGTARAISSCLQQVIINGASILVSIILSEMNEKGKFGLFGPLRVGYKVIKGAWDLATMYRACK